MTMNAEQMNAICDEFNLAPHLSAHWLRPESGLWDAIAARQLAPFVRDRTEMLEVGIGNGLFSFLMLGGELAPEIDWFANVLTEGFWDNADIFDHDAQRVIGPMIRKTPQTRFKCALDHKKSLLNQAARLNFVDHLVEHDCNEPLPALSYANAYSNMLYWLKDPLAAMHDIGGRLPVGGELVTVFPNSDFYYACDSYRNDTPLRKLLNRGRASHIMWHMDLSDFEREVEHRGMFKLRYATRYLSPLVLNIWDIGLRPLSVPLIRMANSLDMEARAAIKREWCETLMKLAEPVLEEELVQGTKHGGYNLVVLSKC